MSRSLPEPQHGTRSRARRVSCQRKAFGAVRTPGRLPVYGGRCPDYKSRETSSLDPRAASFSLTSSDLREGEKLAMPQVSGIFGAGGQDVSPQLSWSGFPAGTKSFVVTMCDPEAPTVTGFWHWAVVNVPGTITELPTGAGDESGSKLPPGAFQLKNDARLARYCGAGPPPGHGRHRYIFAALALEAEKIEIDREATPAWLMFNLFKGTLGRAFLEGWYER